MIMTFLFCSFLAICIFYEIELQIREVRDVNWRKVGQFAKVRQSGAFIAGLVAFGILCGLELLLIARGDLQVGNTLDVLFQLVLYFGLASLAIYYKYLDVLQKDAVPEDIGITRFRRKRLLTAIAALAIFAAFLVRQLKTLM